MHRWLGKVEPIGPSLAVYGPLAILDKLITFARVFLLTWLLSRSAYGVWGLGVMVFSVLAHLLVLGADEGVARYLSHYQTRGRLPEMFRRVSAAALIVALALAAVAAAGSGLIARALSTAPGVPTDLSANQIRTIVLLGVLNAMLMGLFHTLQGCLRAMRTLRLLGVVNLTYTLLFTAGALAVGGLRPSGVGLLWAHAASLGVMLAVGWLGARSCVLAQSADDAGRAASDAAAGVMGKIIRFGAVAMLAGLTWNAASHVSTWFIYRYHGLDAVGGYMPLRRICQPAFILAAILWPVVFGYVANHWESSRRPEALRLLNAAYKLTVLGLTTITMLLLVTAPLWFALLPLAYQANLSVVAGLLMLFQCSANLGMAGMAAKLNERPAALVLIIAVGAAANAVLAAMWVPAGGAAMDGLIGGARAAGVGMLCACAAGALYLAASRFRAHPAVYVLSLSPALLLLPPWWAAAIWAALLIIAAATPWVLTPREKQSLRDLLARWRRRDQGA